MIVIADAGSSNTDWKIISDLNEGREMKPISISTKGINPIYYRENFIINEILILKGFVEFDSVEEIHFYGAGCMSYEGKGIMEKILSGVFINAKIFVLSDIVAACRAVLFNEPGIGIILGTGANIGFYSEGKVYATKSGNGFILGDEGSGSHLGKLLMMDYVNSKTPASINLLLEREYKITKATVIDRVYRSEKPNLFFAQFALFIRKNIENLYLELLVRRSFVELIHIHLDDISDRKNKKIGVVGSVGYNFEGILSTVFEEEGYSRPIVIQKPIERLVEYHLLK